MPGFDVRSRRIFRRVASVGAIVVLGTAGMILAGFTMLPFPRGLDALTMCLPVVGPIQRFDEHLSAQTARIVRIHEGVHAQQCREHGAIRDFVISQTARGRVRFEAEAYCAEMRYGVAHGGNARALLSEARGALYYGYRNRQSVPEAEIREVFRELCPDVH